MNFKILLFCVATGLSSVSFVNADVIDVYFIAGQSNAGNIGELNSFDATGYNGRNRDTANRSQQAFNLDFARINDRDDSFAPINRFSSSQLDPTNFATDRLATNLYAGNDLGIYSFAKNGRALSNSVGTEGWYPGDDPSNGEFFNDGLYGEFQNWSSARIAEIEANGDTANVRGVFWFQGEADSNSDADAELYSANFSNLVDRLRIDFGQDLAVVAADIRVIGASALQGRQNQVNDALDSVAANDPLVDVVAIQDLDFLNTLHLNANGFNDLADRWSASFNAITAVPEPGSAVVIFATLGLTVLRRRRNIG